MKKPKGEKQMSEKPKYTPGPWTLWVNSGRWGLNASDGWPVLKCDSREGYLSEENKANACLIAAAPELLDAANNALNEITNAMECFCDDEVEFTDLKLAANLLREAITKAEGKK